MSNWGARPGRIGLLQLKRVRSHAVCVTDGRTLAALLIAALFVLVLMVASAQQSVIEAIDAADLDIDYNMALRVVRDADAKQQELEQLRAERRALTARGRQLRREQDSANRRFYEVFGEASPIIDQVTSSGQCDPLQQERAREDSSPVRQWQALQACFENGTIPQRWQPQIARLLSGDSLVALRSRVEAADAEISAAAAELAQRETEITAIEQGSSAPLQRLEIVSYLMSLPAVSALGLVDLPPVMMQIILSSVSGLFGALLITLILAVYPNNSFQFATSDDYFKRLFLGGLIALCVFVIIGGGIAVVQTDSGVLQGNGNYLSLCAIGILAGMFSDRVALWISLRSSTVFPTQDGAQTPGPPAADNT